jgi:hypothetical protein
VLTLTHSPFDYQTTYTVSVNAAEDEAGNPLSGAPVQWSFTTLEEPDSIPPQVTAHSPSDGAQGVAVDAAVVISFSEAISASTFSYSVTPDPGGWAAAWSADGMAVRLSHNPFEPWLTYTISISFAADLAGNPLYGAPVTWSFISAPYHLYLPLVINKS